MRNYLDTHLEPAQKEGENKKNSNEFLLDVLPESTTRTLFPKSKSEDEAESIDEVELIYDFDKAESYTVELQNGWHLEWAYELVNQDDIRKYAKRYKHYPMIGAAMAAGEYRRLTELVIKDKNGEGLDLMKDFHVDDIFFWTNPNGLDLYQSGSCAFPRDSTVFSAFPPTNFMGIMLILHEVGHVVNSRSTKAMNPSKAITSARAVVEEPILHTFLPASFVEQASEIVLREERNAWSVAVSALRKTLDAFEVPKEDFMHIIHRYALLGYSKEIRVAREATTWGAIKKLFR